MLTLSSMADKCYASSAIGIILNAHNLSQCGHGSSLKVHQPVLFAVTTPSVPGCDAAIAVPAPRLGHALHQGLERCTLPQALS